MAKVSTTASIMAYSATPCPFVSEYSNRNRVRKVCMWNELLLFRGEETAQTRATGWGGGE